MLQERGIALEFYLEMLEFSLMTFCFPLFTFNINIVYFSKSLKPPHIIMFMISKTNKQTTNTH